jgi:hypothetical protein
MANIIREGLNALNMRLPLYCSGQSKVGFNVAGTFVGTLTPAFSIDGLNFNTPMSLTPFASGATVQTITGPGSWEVQTQNYIAVQLQMTAYTSGTAIVTLATSIDSSYQDAFLASTSIYINQASGANAINTITVAAQANRAWRCRRATISNSAAATWGASPAFKILDGASSILYACDPPVAQGEYEIKLPTDDNTPGRAGGGVVNTPGNSLGIVLQAAGGTAVTNINVEVRAA